jgi:hypothetical protein
MRSSLSNRWFGLVEFVAANGLILPLVVGPVYVAIAIPAFGGPIFAGLLASFLASVAACIRISRRPRGRANRCWD